MMEERPRVVCLCGSVRFLTEFDAASLAETLAGRIVLSVGSHRQRDEVLIIRPGGTRPQPD
ncbi:hypothetical protein GCM10008959_04400 [Deinococcus seoulensis]|uniref:Uncharacterized protein n=2 Tax=Deinococcus seoulensis TaxID=1837379 RepID=A0ABQ2RPX1_9DEIO|nr:hypothetical protein GCM10008959_04400 [Deinococcus seoulensis]